MAGELILIDSTWRPGIAPEQWQQRVLNDGSRHQVYKRYLAGTQLAEESGRHILMDGDWFVAAQANHFSSA